jgi:hypothetical protein
MHLDVVWGLVSFETLSWTCFSFECSSFKDKMTVSGRNPIQISLFTVRSFKGFLLNSPSRMVKCGQPVGIVLTDCDSWFIELHC